MGNQDTSDKELIAKISQDDKAAFRALFNRHYKELLGTAINILRDQDKGKDAVQEVFFQIWKNRAGMEIRSTVRAYLKRSVINRALNQVERGKRFTDDSTLVRKPSGQTDPLEDVSHTELKDALEVALQDLPERCRLVFVMKRLEGMSQKEIAQQLNISTKTVENQITKAVKALKEALLEFRLNNSGGT